MKLVTCAALAALLATPVLATAASNDASLRTQIVSAARQKNLSALQKLSQSASRSSAVVKATYALALYYVAPKSAAQDLVRAFPTDGTTLMALIGALNGVPGVSDYYAYSAIGKLAVAGQPGATQKLLLAASVADGGPAEMLGDSIGLITKKKPAMMLQQLERLPAKTGDQLAQNGYIWCQAGAKSLNAMTASSARQRSLKKAIAASARTCGR